jgi:hypothetical protein
MRIILKVMRHVTSGCGLNRRQKITSSVERVIVSLEAPGSMELIYEFGFSVEVNMPPDKVACLSKCITRDCSVVIHINEIFQVDLFIFTLTFLIFGEDLVIWTEILFQLSNKMEALTGRIDSKQSFFYTSVLRSQYEISLESAH